MSQKASAFRLVWTDWKIASPTRNQVLVLVLSLAAVVLAAATVYLLVSVINPDASSGIAAGVEASSARWSALGATYAPDRSAATAAGSARWTALGAYHLARYEAAAAASSARYQALAEYYNTEAASLVPSMTADSTRWTALGAYHLARYEATAAASSARYQALANWYAAKAVRR